MIVDVGACIAAGSELIAADVGACAFGIASPAMFSKIGFTVPAGGAGAFCNRSDDPSLLAAPYDSALAIDAAAEVEVSVIGPILLKVGSVGLEVTANVSVCALGIG